MIADLLKSLRASWKFLLREIRYRADKRKRASMPDPFEVAVSNAIDNQIRRVINEEKNKP